MASGSRTPPEIEEKIWASWILTQSYLATAREVGVPYATVRGVVLRLAGDDAELAKARQDIRAAMAEEAADIALEAIRHAGDLARTAKAPLPELAAQVADAVARAGASAARVAEVLARVDGKAPLGPQKLEITFKGGGAWAPAPGSGGAPADPGPGPGGDGHGDEPPVAGEDPVPGDQPGGHGGGDGDGA